MERRAVFCALFFGPSAVSGGVSPRLEVVHIARDQRTNRRIRAREVRVVGAAGEQLGVLTIEAALEKANETGLDLVEVNPMAKPPVCKIMDYGKFKYEEKKKASEAKKKQVVVHLKEVKLRPKTEEHDYDFKVRNVKRFLEEGNKARITIMFRGREITHREIGQTDFRRRGEGREGRGRGRADAADGRSADVHDPAPNPKVAQRARDLAQQNAAAGGQGGGKEGRGSRRGRTRRPEASADAGPELRDVEAPADRS